MVCGNTSVGKVFVITRLIVCIPDMSNTGWAQRLPVILTPGRQTWGITRGSWLAISHTEKTLGSTETLLQQGRK